MNNKRVFLTKRSPEYWRVTLNHPPLNIFGPKTIPQLSEIITAIETDKDLSCRLRQRDRRVFHDSLRFPRANRRDNQSATGTDRFAAPPGYARAPEPGLGRVDCVNPRTRHWRRKRTRSGLRHAFRQSRKGDPVAL